jgi:7-cyano-7-deazaguanine synthase
VLLSGGIDSAVVAMMAAERSAYVRFLTFDYQQANRRELTAARRIARLFRKKGPHAIVSLDLSLAASAGRSRLLSRDDRRPAAGFSYGYYVPGRNMIFLAYAAAVAETEDLQAIYVGSNLQDAIGPQGAGYPDSRPEFVALAEQAVNSGLKYGRQVQILAPLLSLPKFEAVRYGHARRLDFRVTWSCYTNGPAACGLCPACRVRVLSFHWAGLIDPATYAVPFRTALSLALTA